MQRSKNTSSSPGFRDTLQRFWQFLHSAQRRSARKFYTWLERRATAHLAKLDPNKESGEFNKARSVTPQSDPESANSDPKSTPVGSHRAQTVAPHDYHYHQNRSEPDPKRANVPQTTAEFLDLMRRTPRTVLSQRERHVIATIMNFPDTKVSELMLPPSAITYVQADEVLGPLTLDRLYRSGYQHFPVLDDRRHIIGLIHTTALNSLEIKQTSRAEELLDPKIYYLREDYTLNQALAAFLRTNCYFFLVIDHYERIVGMLTYQMIVDYLLGETPSDNFDRDHDRLAVAKRK